jgi:hypothetical protein
MSALPDPASPFCTLPAVRVLARNAFAVWIRDAYPVSP